MLFATRGAFPLAKEPYYRSDPMKRFSLRLMLLVAMALLAFGCNGKSVAIVDTTFVQRESIAGQKGGERLQALGMQMQAEYEAGKQKIEEAQKSKNKKAYEEAQAEQKQALLDMQQRLNAEQQMVVTVVTEVYQKALEACRVKGKFAVILPAEGALSFDPAVDITKQMVEEMNAQPLDFSFTEPEAPADAKDAPAQ